MDRQIYHRPMDPTIWPITFHQPIDFPEIRGFQDVPFPKATFWGEVVSGCDEI